MAMGVVRTGRALLLPVRASHVTRNSGALPGCCGLSNTQISEDLHLSSHTIDRHLGDMLRRSNADNRAALVARAYYAGVLVTDTWPPAQSGRRCLPQ
jgi:Bacterial regulatory proteins, luxR family